MKGPKHISEGPPLTLQKLTFHWDQFLFLSLVKVVLLSMAILGSECIKNWLDEGEKSTAKWSRPDRLESCAGMKATPNFLGMNWMTLTKGGVQIIKMEI